MEGFKVGEAVCDVFAGVGPFAVPAGKRKCFVLANDLNPDSYGSMTGNITVNKVLSWFWCVVSSWLMVGGSVCQGV